MIEEMYANMTFMYGNVGVLLRGRVIVIIRNYDI